MNDSLPTSGAVVQQLAQARLPTPHGTFTMSVFQEVATGKEHVALVMAPLPTPPLVRIHSECMTGDVFGSRRCDCGSQLERALAAIGQARGGILLYLRQEGRGIGLVAKLQAYTLQDQGMDTVDANLHLGYAADARDFRVAGHILHALGVSQVRMLTQNPRKLDDLRAAGITVIARQDCLGDLQPDNLSYLQTKRDRMGHLLPPMAP